MSSDLEFSFPVDITTLPPSGRVYAITASEEERARIAARLGLQAVNSLSANLTVAPGRKGFIKVTGDVTADVVQTCVVSLAPVPAQIADTVRANFMTEERAAADQARKERAKTKGKAAQQALEAEEEIIAAQGEDPPEVATEGRIDLGEVAVVHLALALDPYPRAPGAAFDAAAWGLEGETGPQTAEISPFAALSKLKKPGS